MFKDIPLPEECRDPAVRQVYLDALKQVHEERLHRDALRADAEAVAIAKRYENGARANDATGEVLLALPAMALLYYKKAEDFDSSSRADRKTLTKLHPEFKVRNRSAKIQVGYTKPT